MAEQKKERKVQKDEEERDYGNDQPMDEVPQEEPQVQAPQLTASNLKFLLSLPEEDVSSLEKEELKKKLMEMITKDNMTPWYEHIVEVFKWPKDDALLAQMKESNEKELQQLEAKIEEAKKTAGESEIRDAQLAKSHFFARIGDKARALKEYEQNLETAIGSGSRIDLCFSMIRMALMWDDQQLVRKYVEKARGFVEKGGDWERRNLFNIYAASNHMLNRELKDAAKLLLDGVATFTNYALYDYNTFVFYTVVTACSALDRATLRTKVIKNAEILSVINEIPHLKSFLFSLQLQIQGVLRGPPPHRQGRLPRPLPAPPSVLPRARAEEGGLHTVPAVLPQRHPGLHGPGLRTQARFP